MRRSLIAGNWKMNTTVSEAVNLAKEMLVELESIKNVEIVLCPPFISLQSVRDVVKDTIIEMGAQNMYFKDKGAFTGEVSPLMLHGLCQYVILGHSERRQYFGETDALVNDKIKAAFANDILPVLCIGESLAENEAGKTREILYRQINEGLKAVPANNRFVLAYEPIWAIGTGRAATGVQAGETTGFIRRTLADLWGKDAASAVRILYGGSVTGANIGEFVKEADIDGALVGGASLKAAEFISIVRQTASIKT